MGDAGSTDAWLDLVTGTEADEYEAPDTACERCRRRGKDWTGDDPSCGFTFDVFLNDNWNCATLNALRELVEGEDTSQVWNDDYNAAVIPGDGGFVLLRWYKNRGQTQDARWLEFGDEDPRPLTIRQAEETLAFNARWTATRTQEKP